ncbi:MAG: saccharopine dehydrogenase family protein [Planctomycetota bacterium]
MGRRLLIYGANGYSGRLVAARAVSEGLRPVLAGRDGTALAGLGAASGLPHAAFPLDDESALDRALGSTGVVLHCAGPFSATSRPMADACLRTGAHYLDITGELAVFEARLAQDGAARAAGVLLLPGAGLDVVATDCLAAELAARLPGATHLELGLLALGEVSRGTARSMLEALSLGGAECRDGRIVRVPFGGARRTIDFGRGAVPCLSLPWGDVCTAHVSTGIPDVRAYAAAPRWLRRMTRHAPLRALLASGVARAVARRRIDAMPPGPGAQARARGSCLVWGEARDASGRRVEARLQTAEGYTFTARSAVALARHVLEHEPPAGFHTPSQLAGAGFVHTIEGTSRGDGPSPDG